MEGVNDYVSADGGNLEKLAIFLEDSFSTSLMEVFGVLIKRYEDDHITELST